MTDNTLTAVPARDHCLAPDRVEAPLGDASRYGRVFDCPPPTSTRRCRVGTAFSAPQILDMMESLAVGWTTTARGLLVCTRRLSRERSRYRAGIAEAVQRIVRTG